MGDLGSAFIRLLYRIYAEDWGGQHAWGIRGRGWVPVHFLFGRTRRDLNRPDPADLRRGAGLRGPRARDTHQHRVDRGHLPGDAEWGVRREQGLRARLSQSLRHELAAKGVTVQAVLPGATATEFWDIAGLPVTNLPEAWVMTAENMVDASSTTRRSGRPTRRRASCCGPTSAGPSRRRGTASRPPCSPREVRYRRGWIRRAPSVMIVPGSGRRETEYAAARAQRTRPKQLTSAA